MSADPILVVAKRAVIADRRCVENYDKSHAYYETASISVKECHERFSEISPTWEMFVEAYLPFGLKWANNLVRIAKLNPKERKVEVDKRAEQQRQLRIERGDAAPRVDVVVEEYPSGKLNSLTDAPKTGAERQAKVDAKKRAEKIASGKQADKPPVRPIADRRLIKSISKQLQVMTLKQLHETEAWIYEEFFAPDCASRAIV